MKKLMFFAVCMLLLVAGGARADYTTTLVLGSNSNSIPLLLPYGTEGGGSFDISYLGGQQLPYVYCLGITTFIGLNQSYSSTNVNQAGQVWDNGFPPGGATLNNVTNADKIAYLLAHYASNNDQVALQAAIWHEAWGADLNQNAVSTTVKNDYLAYIDNPGSGNVADFLWLSPSNGQVSFGNRYVWDQALVTRSPVPIPPAIWLLGSGLFGMIGIRRRFKK